MLQNTNEKLINKMHFKWEDLIYYFSAFAIYLLFNLLLINNFVTITEGWWQDYARYIIKGELMYVDFYMYIPPGFPILTTTLIRLFGYSFLPLRIYGVIERMVLFTLTYLIFTRLFKSNRLIVPILCASVTYISNLQDVFYGYYQSSLLLIVVVLYFVTLSLDNFTNKKVFVYSALAGVFVALTILFKHVTGVIMPIAIYFVYFIITFKSDLKRSLFSITTAILSCVFVLALTFGYMAILGNLSACLNSIFGTSSSKGSLVSVLFSFFTRIEYRPAITILIFILGYFVLEFFANKYKENKKKYYLFSSFCLTLIVIAIINLLYFTFKKAQLFKGLQQNKATLVALIIFVLLLLIAKAFDFIKYKFELKNDNNSLIKYNVFTLIKCILFALAVISMLIVLKNDKISVFDHNLIRNTRALIIAGVFFAEIVYSIYLLSLFLLKKNLGDKSEIATNLLISVFAWGIMYIHGMSGSIEDHATLFAYTHLFGKMLTSKIALGFIKNVFVIMVSFTFIFTSFTQRVHLPYFWWGNESCAPVQMATEEFKTPILKGIKSDKKTVESIDAIYDIVNNNKKENDTMYTFPHINFFNVIFEMDSPTFAKTHFFDVCPDDVAIKDAKLLKEKKPSFIIVNDLSQTAWDVHEELFRAGNRCGQHDIVERIDEMVKNGDYTLLGKYKVYTSNDILVYVINDGRTHNN